LHFEHLRCLGLSEDAFLLLDNLRSGACANRILRGVDVLGMMGVLDGCLVLGGWMRDLGVVSRGILCQFASRRCC
jgi:hypothetical protein